MSLSGGAGLRPSVALPRSSDRSPCRSAQATAAPSGGHHRATAPRIAERAARRVVGMRGISAAQCEALVAAIGDRTTSPGTTHRIVDALARGRRLARLDEPVGQGPIDIPRPCFTPSSVSRRVAPDRRILRATSGQRIIAPSHVVQCRSPPHNCTVLQGLTRL